MGIIIRLFAAYLAFLPVSIPTSWGTESVTTKGPGPSPTAEAISSQISGELFFFRRSVGTAPAEIFLRGGKGSFLWPKANQSESQIRYLEAALKSTKSISLKLDPNTKLVIEIPSYKNGNQN